MNEHRSGRLSGLAVAAALTLAACGSPSRELSPGSVAATTASHPVGVVASESAEPAGAVASPTQLMSSAPPIHRPRSYSSAGPAATLTGPFGSGSYGHLKITITSAELSNVDLDDWGQTGATAIDPDARYLYVTLEVVNEDPNDEIRFADKELTLQVGSRPPVVAERVNRGGHFSQSIAAQDTSVREFGFVVDGGAPVEQLRYASQTVPVTIPIIASAGARTPTRWTSFRRQRSLQRRTAGRVHGQLDGGRSTRRRSPSTCRRT